MTAGSQSAELRTTEHADVSGITVDEVDGNGLIVADLLVLDGDQKESGFEEGRVGCLRRTGGSR